MKFYVHYEKAPELTLVVKWEEGKEGAIENLISTFVQSYNNKHGDLLQKENVVLVNERGKPYPRDASVKKTVKDKSDLFAVEKYAETEMPYTENTVSHQSGVVKEKKPAVSVGKSSCTKTSTLISNLISKGEEFMNEKKVRKALTNFESVLSLQPENINALVHIAQIYMKVSRGKDALVYLKKAVKCQPYNTQILELLGDCLTDCGLYKEALANYSLNLQELKSNHGNSDSDKEILDIKCKIGKAFVKKGDAQAGMNCFVEVLNITREHFDALSQYALLTAPSGSELLREAVIILLTVLVHRNADKETSAKLATVAKFPGGYETLKTELKESWDSVSAVSLIATCLRDHGAIEESLKFSERACQLDPSSSSQFLFHFHLFEVLHRHQDGFSSAVKFFQTNGNLSAGYLKCSDVLKLVDKVNMIYLTDAVSESQPKSCIKTTSKVSPEEYQLLGIWFTLVKVLFMRGALEIIKPLVALLSPLHDGKNLHLTPIRNEAAYFSCIQDLIKLPVQIPHKDTKFVYYFADSHCLPPAWREICCYGDEYVLHPILATGLKIWHLRPESEFYPKFAFYNAVKSIPNGSMVVFNFGEIDCRLGFHTAVEKCKYDSLENAVTVAVRIYIDVLKDLKAKHSFVIFVHPVLPVLNETRTMVKLFNRMLMSKVKESTCLYWLDFVDELLDDGCNLKAEFQLDGTHVHPQFLQLLEQAMAKHIS